MENKVTYSATQYVQYRPTYPDTLFAFIEQYVNKFNLAWDCGCGNGQAASQLAAKFKHVIATDIAAPQIEHAIKKNNISYEVTPAERTNIKSQSTDLVTVAQALHWFDHAAFTKEIKRVLKPNGVLAVWGYSLPRINKEIDIVIDYTAVDLLANYWAKGREYVNNRYRDIPFPFQKIENNTFCCSLKYNLNSLLGYLESWSPRLNYLRKHGQDPLDLIKPKLTALWGKPEEYKTVKFPIFLLLGINQ